MIKFQNFHRHSSYSNIFTPDSSVMIEDYAKRAVELEHKILSSCEHGWQGHYYNTYDLAKKYNLKFIFGTEAYWVKNRFDKDRTNSHICIFAKSEIGRRAINKILSQANIEGYYYKPRVDLELLLSLPNDEVFISSACVAFWLYEDIKDIIIQLHNHFKENFMLEVQYHDTDKQKEINRMIVDLSNNHSIDIIMGCDSHYIYPHQSQERDDVLQAKGIRYEEEYGWYLDYPNGEEAYNRFITQGILNEQNILKAINNTNIFLEFEDIKFNDNIKLPTLYPDLTQKEKDKKYTTLLTKKWNEYSETVPKEEHERYIEGMKQEVKIIKNTSMSDYFLIDHAIVEEALKNGGIITKSGRGSGVGYFTNTLLGFSNVDRFTSPITLYPERFISESRILETKSLPDLDLNTGNPEVFAQAQTTILGENHAYPMIAFGTFKRKSAFKLYAKSQELPFEIANEISTQLEKYERDLLYADEDDKDTIDVYDYVNEQYHNLVKDSEKYMGIISEKKSHPCGYLIYAGDIPSEIGLIKCKSESTGKEVITTVIDGAVAEKYKFLKNDLLKVDVSLLIDKIYKRIGIKAHTVNELMEIIKGNKKVWDIYSTGFTLGINQVEKESTRKKVMKYAPTNISELCAFIAAIRPAFKSMYSIFESRKPFDYGIKSFDKIIQTEELPQSFVLYQEQTMATLNYAGFPIDECYGIIKSISKKHPEKVKPLKEKFINGFTEKIIEEDQIEKYQAQKMSEKVWTIIDNSCQYGFNSAHAYCMSLDSAYCAYLKSYYPLEFYETLLKVYTEKKNKEKVSMLKKEMKEGFNIELENFKWGSDNRDFVIIKDENKITQTLASLKYLSQKLANDLYKLSTKKIYDNFIELLNDLSKLKSLNSRQLNILVKINYFQEFAGAKKILQFLKYYDVLSTAKQLSKEKAKELKIPENIMLNYSRATEKTYMELNVLGLLQEIWDKITDKSLNLKDQIQTEIEYLGYPSTINQSISKEYAFIVDINTRYSYIPTLYYINDGTFETIKTDMKNYKKNPYEKFDIIKIINLTERFKKKYMGKNENSKAIYETTEEKEIILSNWVKEDL